MKFQLFGASDDIACCTGAVNGEIGCYNGAVAVQIGARGEHCTIVVLEYAADFPALGRPSGGVWTAVVMPDDEEVPMHPCTIELGERGYSPLLTFDVPVGTPVVWRTSNGDWESPS